MYRNKQYENGYVIAQEKCMFGNTYYYNYICDIHYDKDKNKYHFTWCQNLEYAHTFCFPINYSKRDIKLASEKMLKEYGLFGKVNIYELEVLYKVKNKII